MNPFHFSFFRLLLLLNAAAISFYFIIQYHLGFPDTISQNMFSTDDSQEYRDYTQWLSGNSDYCNPWRTYLYPLLILGARSLMDETGIWLMQFLFWSAACNLVFLAVMRTTGNRIASSIVFIICASNISLINLTTHALTEVTVSFFLALTIFFFARAFTGKQSARSFMPALFSLSALAVIKPQYMVLWYPAALIFIFVFRRRLLKPKIALLTIACMIPVLVQKTINKVEHGRLSSTAIGDSNLRLYYYRKVKHVVDHGSIESFEAQSEEQHRQEKQHAMAVSKKEIYSFLADHPGASIRVFFDNLKDNMGARHPYIDHDTHPTLLKWTENTNNKFYYLNLAGFLGWLVFLVMRIRSDNAADRLTIASGALAYFALFTTGLAFWAGDRLIAPAIIAWSSCYALMIVQLMKVFSSRTRTVSGQ